MVELKVYLSQRVNEKFRRLAMSTYGYGRGSLSRAAEEAFSKWCTEHEMQPTRETEPSGPNIEKIPVEQIRSRINPDERPIKKAESNIAEKDDSSSQDNSST